MATAMKAKKVKVQLTANVHKASEVYSRMLILYYIRGMRSKEWGNEKERKKGDFLDFSFVR